MDKADQYLNLYDVLMTLENGGYEAATLKNVMAAIFDELPQSVAQEIERKTSQYDLY